MFSINHNLHTTVACSATSWNKQSNILRSPSVPDAGILNCGRLIHALAHSDLEVYGFAIVNLIYHNTRRLEGENRKEETAS